MAVETASRFLIAGGIAALSLGGLAVTGALALATAAAFGLGAAAGMIGGTALPYLQRNADENMTGRVMSVFYLATAGIGPVSGALFGHLAEASGTGFALAAVALLLLCAAVTAHAGLRP